MGNKHNKRPAFAVAPPAQGKQPRVGVHDPGIEAVRKPAWRFQYLDLGGPFGWRNCEDSHLEPVLCATTLFGCIEMGLTSFVMGLLDKRDEAAIDRAREQVAETFLNGVCAVPPAPAKTTERPRVRS